MFNRGGLQPVKSRFKFTAHARGHQCGGAVIAVEVIERPADVELTPARQLFGREYRLKFGNGLAERQGEDMEEPRLAALG